MCRIEREGAPARPVGVPERRERLAARVAQQELGVDLREARARRGQERREPDTRAKALGPDLARERREPLGKAGSGREPVTDRRLEAVVDLDHVERPAQPAQRAQVAAHVLGLHARAEAVPRAPAAERARGYGRAHLAARALRPLAERLLERRADAEPQALAGKGAAGRE